MLHFSPGSLLLPQKSLSKKEIIQILLVLALFISLPFPQKVSSTIMILNAVFVLFTVGLVKLWTNAKFSLIIKLILVYLMFFVVSAVTSEDSFEGLKQIEKKIPILLCPIIFLSPVIKELKIRLLFLRVLIFTWTGIALYALAVTAFINFDYEIGDAALFSYALPSAAFGMASNYFALYTGFCFLVLMVGVVEDFFKKTILNYVLLTFLFLFLALLSSRMAFFATILIAVGFYISKAISRKQRIGVHIAVIAVLTFATVMASWNVPYLRHRILSMQTDERPQMLATGMKIAKENLWWGIGIGDVSAEVHRQFKESGYPYSRTYHHVHNDFLHHLIAIGIFGLTVYLLILGHCFYSGLRQKNPLAMVFIVFYVLASQTEVLSTRHLGLMFFSLMFSLFFIYPNGKKNPSC